MRGPLPKDPALRQRTNKVATAATLRVQDRPRRTPALPARSEGQDWQHLTRVWWRSVWRSPMASEYLDADIKGRLYRLAALVDQFWCKPSVLLDAQICRNEAALGLSPMDRRRLQWTVEKAEQESRKRRQPDRSDAGVTDMRDLLKVLSS